MAKPWAEVANSEGYKALAPEQQEAARNQYFDTVVAPRAPQDKIDAVRAQFDSATKPQAAPATSVEQDVLANRQAAMQEGQLNTDGSAVIRQDGTSIPFGEPTNLRNDPNSQGFLAAQQQAPVKKLQLPDKVESPIRKYMRQGFVKGLIDPINAGAQLLDKSLPESASQTLHRGDQWLYENTGGVLGTDAPTFTEGLQQEEAAYQAQRAAEGETGFDADRIAGNIAVTSIPMVKGAKALQVMGAGAKTIGATLGAAGGALTPALSDDYLSEKAAQIGGGALAGAVLPVVGQAIGKVISPAASTNPALQKVLSEGGKPTIGQALGGRLNTLEEKAMSVPILGDMISVARKRAVESIEPAAYNRALSAIGQKLPQGMKGRDALVHTERVLKDKYDDVLTKIGAITPDKQFGSKIDSLTDLVDKMNIPQAAKDKFSFALDSVKSATDGNGVITSEAYKKAESALGGYARKLGGSQDVYDDALAPAVSQLREEMRSMLERTAGSHAKELKAANKGWANFKVLQKAAGGIGAEEGAFSPAQLQSAVRAADKSKDKAAYARGNALMQDLAEASKTVMGNKTPNSFTADRMLFNLGALGSYAINPAIPAGLAAGGAAYTAPVQNALVSMVARRPEAAAALGARLNAMAQGSAAPGAIALSPLASRAGVSDGN